MITTLRKTAASAMAAVLVMATVPVVAMQQAHPAYAADTQVMYRLYNPNSGEHFYTASELERDSLADVGWNYEGTAWTAPVSSSTPVYRLYSGTDHHYCTGEGERDGLVEAGWSYEGIGWYSDDARGVPLYRQFNPYVDPGAPTNNSGSHNYTTSRDEHEMLVGIGWIDEGVGWYGVNASTSQGGSTSGSTDSSSPSGPSTPELVKPATPSYSRSEASFDYISATYSVEVPFTNVEWELYQGGKRVATQTTTTNFVTFTGLQSSTRYDLRARVFNAGVYSDWSGYTSIATVAGSSSDTTTPSTQLTEQQAINAVTKYSYKVTPVNGSLNSYVFVETDNPDPTSFCLYDGSSTYADSSRNTAFNASYARNTTFTSTMGYRDVAYTNANTGRIANKGYLFYSNYGYADGGTLDLIAVANGTKYDTKQKVSCPTLIDRVDYLIRTYASNKTNFFDKLDAVQAGLDQIAVYPKTTIDTSTRASTEGYSCLINSRYPEQGISPYVVKPYEADEYGLLITRLYGFCLDSLGFPSMMNSVAKRLQPSCTTESVSYQHYSTKITYGGTSKTYGGAGNYDTEYDEIYTGFVEKTFSFNGSDTGYGTNYSQQTAKAKLASYIQKSDAYAPSIYDAEREKVSSASVRKKLTTAGEWITVSNYFHYGSVFSYAYPLPASSTGVSYLGSTWVDGRYIDEFEGYKAGETYADHPNASILVHDKTYMDYGNIIHRGDVLYFYEKDDDCWYAGFNSVKKNCP